MIAINEEAVLALFKQAQEEAQQTKKQVYTSYTQQIDVLNILNVFKQARKTGANRSFWHSYEDNYTLVGIGEMEKISANETDYASINQEWKELIKQAIIVNPYESFGTGMLSFGGLRFDPKKERTPLWKEYPTYELVVPKYTFMQDQNNYYLTLNVKVTQDTVISEMLDLVLNEVKRATRTDQIIENEKKVLVTRDEIEPIQWKKSVQQAKDAIIEGYAKKIVLAREMRLTFENDLIIGDIIEALLKTQPNSYVFAFEKGEDTFVGATPERLVKVSGDKLLSTCLAGTMPRGKTKEEDQALANELFNDAKNREEHNYVVEMITESIEAMCQQIKVPNEPFVHRLKNVHHLFTPVTAQLKKPYTILDIVTTLHPTPALGGHPNEESLAFIRDYELLDRGWYGAPVGWLDNQFNGEFAVAIRSGLIQNNAASLFAGCGVMRDSNVELEYEETNVKFLPMLNVLEGKA